MFTLHKNTLYLLSIYCFEIIAFFIFHDNIQRICCFAIYLIRPIASIWEKLCQGREFGIGSVPIFANGQSASTIPTTGAYK